MIEPRSEWAQNLLYNLSMHPNATIGHKGTEALIVLTLGAEKHGDEPPAKAREHLEHLEAHMRRIPFREEESGFPHEAHAAVRALLLFGALMGLDR